MIRYAMLGLVLFLAFAASFAPADLLDRILERNSDADLIETRGTVWRGQGQLLMRQIPIGNLDWDFQFASLLRVTPSYALTLLGEHWRLDGVAGVDFSATHVDVEGSVGGDAANQWLRVYDIQVSGDFDIAPTTLTFNRTAAALTKLDGQMTWSGGRVRYALSGILHEATLPAMTAFLQMTDAGMPQAVVYADGIATPLLIASQGASGFIKVGITKLFTKLLQNPWPGSDPDHAIVLEVEEQIF